MDVLFDPVTVFNWLFYPRKVNKNQTQPSNLIVPEWLFKKTGTRLKKLAHIIMNSFFYICFYL